MRYAAPLFLLSSLIWGSSAMAAPVTMTKTASTKSDPLNNLLPRAIPGAIIEYKVALAGATTSSISLEFMDKVPANTSFCLSGFDLSGAPVVFIDTSFLLSSGLSFPFSSVTSPSDNLDFSKDNGVTWNYQPTSDANGCDDLVTNIRVRFNGTFGAGKTAQLQFRVRLR